MAVEWLVGALASLRVVAEYIAEDNPERSKSFVREVREKTELLQQFPTLGRSGRVIDTRELVVHENYVIVYRMRRKNVQVLRVHHVRQKHPKRID
jgi:toxin ParE1/3/4